MFLPHVLHILLCLATLFLFQRPQAHATMPELVVNEQGVSVLSHCRRHCPVGHNSTQDPPPSHIVVGPSTVSGMGLFVRGGNAGAGTTVFKTGQVIYVENPIIGSNFQGYSQWMKGQHSKLQPEEFYSLVWTLVKHALVDPTLKNQVLGKNYAMNEEIVAKILEESGNKKFLAGLLLEQYAEDEVKELLQIFATNYFMSEHQTRAIFAVLGARMNHSKRPNAVFKTERCNDSCYVTSCVALMDIAVEQDGQVELFLDYGKGYEGMF